jgi:hypothetical protein
MDQEIWTQVASEAIERLAPFGPVILQGLETVRRQMGRHIERRVFVSAKSVYALLKATFQRDDRPTAQELLEQFVKEPDRYRAEMIELVAQRASSSPNDLGRKLIALTNRWREDKRPGPPAG